MALKETTADERVNVGPVAYHAPDDVIEDWSIFQDVATLLGGRFDNYEVELLLGSYLLKHDRSRLERLEFDSEADNFCVYARSEKDIRAVAEVLRDMVEASR
jgi:hypothetical protein